MERVLDIDSFFVRAVVKGGKIIGFRHEENMEKLLDDRYLKGGQKYYGKIFVERRAKDRVYYRVLPTKKHMPSYVPIL